MNSRLDTADLTAALTALDAAARLGGLASAVLRDTAAFETRLLGFTRQVMGAARQAGPAAWYHVAPVLDCLEACVDVAHWSEDTRRGNPEVPTRLDVLADACCEALARIKRGDPIPAS
jgi:hypothetical protein